MRVSLIAIGSTGDVQPMLVLGKALMMRGHRAGIAAFEAHRCVIEQAGLDFYPLPGDAERYIGNIIKPGANPLTYLSRLEDALLPQVGPIFDMIYEACRAADAIVAGFFGTMVYSIAEKLNKPLFQSNYCLTDCTGDFSIPVMRQHAWGHAMNRATYRLAYKMIDMLERRYITPLCHEYGMRPRTMRTGPDYQVGAWRVPVLYAISEHVVPRPKEWPDNIHITGFWEDRVQDFTPSPALDAFLSDAEMPVYIGFGSMTSGDMGQALHTVLEAAGRCGVRVVLSSGWGGLDAALLPDHVHVLREYIPHRWLFERMRAVVHHGGAGTTAAGLTAGKPSLAVPFGGDQFFWGDRMHALGCGPKPILRTRLRADRLSDALSDLLENPSYERHAASLREKLLNEDGALAAAEMIERFVNNG